MSARSQAGRGGRGYELEALPAAHAICRLEAREPEPAWARPAPGAILSVTRSEAELSIVCAEQLPPSAVLRTEGWRAIRVAGALDHGLTGVLASLATPLAEAGVPIFAISSFDTDYVLVPGDYLERALETLAAAGHRLR